MFDGPWQSCMLVRGLEPSECASWVQAWGTIGAILVTAGAAVFTYWSANRDRQRLEARDSRERDLTVARLFSEALPIFGRMVDIEERSMPDRDTNKPPEAFFNRVLHYKMGAIDRDLFAVQTYIAALQRVDVADLADAAASTALIAGLFGLRQLEDHLRLMKSSLNAMDSKANFIFGNVRPGLNAVVQAETIFRDRAAK